MPLLVVRIEVHALDPIRLGIESRWRDRRRPRGQAEAFQDRPDRIERVDRGENAEAASARITFEDSTRKTLAMSSGHE